MDIQGKLYTHVVRQNMDADEDYRDYSIEGFVFVYASRIGKCPMIWTFGDCFSHDNITITTRNGNTIVLEDFRKPLKEMAMIKAEQRTVPIGMSKDGPNEIMDHLKEF